MIEEVGHAAGGHNVVSDLDLLQGVGKRRSSQGILLAGYKIFVVQMRAGGNTLQVELAGLLGLGNIDILRRTDGVDGRIVGFLAVLEAGCVGCCLECFQTFRKLFAYQNVVIVGDPGLFGVICRIGQIGILGAKAHVIRSCSILLVDGGQIFREIIADPVVFGVGCQIFHAPGVIDIGIEFIAVVEQGTDVGMILKNGSKAFAAQPVIHVIGHVFRIHVVDHIPVHGGVDALAAGRNEIHGNHFVLGVIL